MATRTHVSWYPHMYVAMKVTMYICSFESDYIWQHMNIWKSGDIASSHVRVGMCLYVPIRNLCFMPSERKSNSLTYLVV